MTARRRFQLVLLKPSHYDDDGYVIRWWRAMIPSNSLAAVYAIAADCAKRLVLGPDVAKTAGASIAHIRKVAGDVDTVRGSSVESLLELSGGPRLDEAQADFRLLASSHTPWKKASYWRLQFRTKITRSASSTLEG
jgi:hypothetical protein